MVDDAHLYTIQVTKQTLGHGTTKIYELIGAGILDARKAGGRTLITGDSIRSYVANLPKADIRTGQKAADGAADRADTPVVMGGRRSTSTVA